MRSIDGCDSELYGIRLRICKTGGEDGVLIGMGFPVEKKSTLENTHLAIIIILILIVEMEFLELTPICSESGAR